MTIARAYPLSTLLLAVLLTQVVFWSIIQATT